MLGGDARFEHQQDHGHLDAADGLPGAQLCPRRQPAPGRPTVQVPGRPTESQPVQGHALALRVIPLFDFTFLILLFRILILIFDYWPGTNGTCPSPTSRTVRPTSSPLGSTWKATVVLFLIFLRDSIRIND